MMLEALRQSRQSWGGSSKKQREILVQARLILFHKEQIIASGSHDLLAHVALGKERVGAQEAALHQDRREERLDPAELMLFLGHHLLFEHNARVGFVEVHVVHSPLVRRQSEAEATLENEAAS
nr:hypothetical protein [Dictyobacter formicarum]